MAKIALEDLSLGHIAIKELADKASLAKATADNKDWRVRLIFKFIAAFDTVPAEHRGRLMMEVLPAIRVLSIPAVNSAVGDIDSIRTEWNDTYQSYIGERMGGSKKGDIFTCSIKVQKLPDPLSHTWSTDFPARITSLFFEPANINTSDLLIKPFEMLTDQMFLAEVAQNDKDFRVREAAVKNPNLTDQVLLADLAKNDKNSWVRIAAAEKLIDQTVAQAVFADIARNGESIMRLLKGPIYLRGLAVEKLTNQAVLAEVARNDENFAVREAAVKNPNLTDQVLLADLAKNDKYAGLRQAAVKKLTDQSVLADIAKNDENNYVRILAERRLRELQRK